MLHIALWCSLGAVVFAYFGYPLSLLLLSLVVRRRVKRACITPSVTHIITVFNEEKRLGAKLDNAVALQYPVHIETIVASDGSTDRTHEIARTYSDRGVRLLEVAKGGKENAQRHAVAASTGEIVVFSDAATRMDPDAIARIVQNFADPSIGCVSSEDRVIDEQDQASSGGEGAYVAYEMLLRKLESRVHSVVGLSGSFFAARRDVCSDLAPDMQSDFRTLLNSMRMGLRGVTDPDVTGYYRDIKDSGKEFNRKVRTVLRGLTVFFKHLLFLNPVKFGIFSYEYFSHKLMRWLVPFFLLAALLANGAVVLLGSATVYKALLAMQAAFYATALLGILVPAAAKNPAIKIPTFFVLVNASIAVAWWRFVSGARQVMWNPSDR